MENKLVSAGAAFVQCAAFDTCANPIEKNMKKLSADTGAVDVVSDVVLEQPRTSCRCCIGPEGILETSFRASFWCGSRGRVGVALLEMGRRYWRCGRRFGSRFGAAPDLV